MSYLFTTQGYFLNQPVEFSVSKISTNLYLAVSNDEAIKTSIVKKVGGTWTSDNKMTQFISAKIGVSIDRYENDKMRKITAFVRSFFASSEAKEKPTPATTVIQGLARI